MVNAGKDGEELEFVDTVIENTNHRFFPFDPVILLGIYTKKNANMFS